MLNRKMLRRRTALTVVAVAAFVAILGGKLVESWSTSRWSEPTPCSVRP